MWWLPLLAGFFAGSACTFIWRGRGIVASFISGVAAGEAIAFFEAFVIVPRMRPPPLETYLQYPSFVMMVGLFWAALWGIGVVFGIPIGLKLRARKSSV